jgi:hypothetical protein
MGTKIDSRTRTKYDGNSVTDNDGVWPILHPFVDWHPMDDGEKKSPFDFRRSTFKAVIDKEDAKKKRETVINAVRRQKKEDRWQKFRSTSSGGHEAGVGALNSPGQGATLMEALQPTKNLDPTVAAKVCDCAVPRGYPREPASQTVGLPLCVACLSCPLPLRNCVAAGADPPNVSHGFLQQSC